MPLPRPTTPAGRAALDAIIAAPSSALLAFDFDGTLAPIVADPRDSRPLPSVVDALAALAPVVGGTAVVTGRPAATAVAYGGLDRVPGITVLGHYGLERWEGGRLDAPDPHPGLAEVRAELPGLVEAARARFPGAEGTAVEDKERALAVHTRRAADPEGALRELRGPLERLAERTGLAVEPGRMVIELRPPGMDKGAALAGLAADRGARSLLYAGDDLGDLPAFGTVRRLRADGVPGLAVCSGSTEVSALAEEADLVVDGPAGVAALLEGLLAAVRPG
ncbi:trehalose-phosphatase [Nocardiopsis composta]|uniref:Trehalose 6-phosphate phosphatase n=1 Tax=Nocardiopsis composta TaxID=157465 RepID=A0A7W8QPI2_9ACTN|nr:trehalose-phosphatase [Nocardiopsis composta]MBB5434210.1 trehalose 6-phosphate phosphatase [Nocardiopsis composta]